MAQFGFRNLGLRCITSWCIADNVASARVLERLGFWLERRQCRQQYFKGRWWDTLNYALASDQWQRRPGIVYIESD